MKLLPIVGRELRENSRRSGTYWLRVRVAAQAVIIGIAAYFFSAINPAVKLGTGLFWGVSAVSMLFCLYAGRRSTVDCISREKRDGTLGLLFLTDLKGYDVVLGKLAATSVTALYAMMAVVPVLAMPLLTGGMSSGEGLRMVTVLANTFFFSISVGIFASSVSRDHRTAGGTNLLLWLALVGAPVACGFLAAGGWTVAPKAVFLCTCPVYSFLACADGFRAAGTTGFWSTVGRDFWVSIAVTNALAWLMVLLACRVVPRTWGDKPEIARGQSRRRRWKDVWEWISYGGAPGRRIFRKHALDRNAYFWHAARSRFKPAHVWLFIILSSIWWLVCWFLEGRIWLDEATFIATTALLNTTFKLWITLEAAQQMGEDRRSGAFELLLATPLTAREIIGGQLLALRRQFLKPLALTIAVEVIFVGLLKWRAPESAGSITLALIVLPADIAALIGVAISAALLGKTQPQATVAAALRILILPWVAVGIVFWAAQSLYWLTLVHNAPGARFGRVAWLCIALGADWFFGWQAWRSLRRNFHALATQTPQRVTLWAWFKNAAAASRAVAGRIVPARWRVPAMAGLAVVATLGIVHYTQPEKIVFPPPIIVSITQSNGPLRIFSGGYRAAVFILPDGSLWRWGGIGATSARGAMPEQVGTNRNWIKVVSRGIHCVGLRADGTLWDGDVNTPASLSAKPVIAGSNWVDFAAGPMGDGSIVLKKDGTIWDWGKYQPTRNSPASTNVTQIGTASNWTAVANRGSAFLALRSDGTLWTWGMMVAGRNALAFRQTNIDDPEQLCAETNWISIDFNGQARNRAGELWDTAEGFPKSDAPASAVCRRISADRAADHIETAPYWLDCRIRPDGTLWSTGVQQGNSFASAPPSAPLRRLGNRADWVSIWGLRGTAFGLTADGTVWAWGYDLGRESTATARTRFQMLRELLDGRASQPGSLWTAGLPPSPTLEEPRPLLKLRSASQP